MMKRLVLTGILIASITPFAFAQKQVRKDLREGNKEYKKGNITDAEVDYRRALERNARSVEAAYNLGNALYKQGKGQESLEQYKTVTENETDNAKLSQAWHNIGNVFLAASKDQQGNRDNKALTQSIEAYKTALRKHPEDDETRYNLALAQKLLQDNQNQNQDQDQQDQQQDKQEQKQKQQQEQQQQQNQEQQNQEQQQQNPNEMSRQNADQILDAIMQEEKNTQEKVKMQQQQQQRQGKTKKNW